MKNPPNPGTKAAIKAGCTCPVLDNHHGWGSMYGEGVFIFVEGCPVHQLQQDRHLPVDH